LHNFISLGLGTGNRQLLWVRFVDDVQGKTVLTPLATIDSNISISSSESIANIRPSSAIIRSILGSSFTGGLYHLTRLGNNRARNSFVRPSPPRLMPTNLYGDSSIAALVNKNFASLTAIFNDRTSWQRLTLNYIHG
jgi:hypothetical protein